MKKFDLLALNVIDTMFILSPFKIKVINASKSDAMLGVAREQCANTLYTYSFATNFSNVLYYGGVVL